MSASYSHALMWLSPILAGLFWLGTWMLYRTARRRRVIYRRAGALIWGAHAAVYWSVNTVLRWLFDYNSPTVFISAWASVLFIHAALSLVLMAVVLAQYESPPGSS